MGSVENSDPWAPFDNYGDCSVGVCTRFCPQFCNLIFSPPLKDDDSGTTFSPLIIAIVCVIAIISIVASHFAVVARCCNRNHDDIRPRVENRNELSPDQSRQAAATGLDDALLETIKVCKYEKGKGSIEGITECAVCLSEFQETEPLRLLPKCGHAFHLPCIDAWLKSQSSCPLCRADADPSMLDSSVAAVNVQTRSALYSSSTAMSSYEIQPTNYQLVVVVVVDDRETGSSREHAAGAVSDHGETPKRARSPMAAAFIAIPRSLRLRPSTSGAIHKSLVLPSFSVTPSFPTFCSSAAVSASGTPEVSPLLSISEKREIRSPELVSREYADLGLSEKFCEEVGHVRIRQHANPLRSTLMMPVELPEWSMVYEDPTLPLMVDIGSGSGRFLLWLAKRNRGLKNYLGLEIRPKLAKRAQYWVNELAMKNIHFIFANATVSFKQLVSAYPGPLTVVSILCPDPHFKKKHHKRRVVQKPLVESIVDGLVPGGQVFIQSDVLEVALDMRDYFDTESDKIMHIDKVNPGVLCDNEGWLLNNPMGIRTEREVHAEFEGARIYRRLYQKQS